MLISKKKILAIEWDKRFLRLIEFIPDQTAPKIITSLAESISEDVDIEDPQNIGDFIRNILEKNEIKSKEAIFVIGRERAFLHQLEIPASPDEQVANLVKYQLTSELPFPVEQANIDYIITRRNEQNYVTEVLAVAVRSNLIDVMQHISEIAKLKLTRIGFRPYANYLTIKNIGEISDKISLFANVYTENIEIDALSSSGIIFSRSIGIKTEESITEQLTLQLKRSLQLCQVESNFQTPEKIIIASANPDNKISYEQISEELNIPIESLKLPIISDNKLSNSGAFITLSGIAIEHSLPASNKFNFINPKRSIDPQTIRAKQIRLAVATIAALMILGIIYSHQLLAEKKQLYAKLQTINKQKSKQLRLFKKFQTQVDAIKQWNEKKVNWLEQIKTITDLMPSNDQAYIHSIVLVESKKPNIIAQIIIDGQATSSKVIDLILQKLEASKKFSEIKPGKQIPKEQNTNYPESFKIRLTIAKQQKSKTK